MALAAVCAAFAFVPTVAFGQNNLVNDLLKGVTGILDGSGGAGGGGGEQAQPQAGAPPSYTPPLTGGNPHGQGDVATVDLSPDNALPQPSGVDDGPLITVGQARGEQDANGNYHGRVVLLDENLLNLVNVSVETDEGQTENGPLAPLQDLLDDLCTTAGLGPAGCVTVAAMNSSTDASGSQNSFELAGTDIGLDLSALGLGAVGVQTSTASSSGNISEDANCQTASGTSNVEDASIGVGALVGVTADALQGSSESKACNDSTQNSVDQDSTVAELNGGPVLSLLPVFQQFTQNCDAGVENAEFTDLSPVAALICNADTSNSGQTSSPYGVREALGVFALIVGGNPLLKVVAGGPESHAVAPGTQPPTEPPAQPPADDGGGQQGGGGGGGDDDGGPGGPGGPATTTAQAGGDELAFTGANMLVLGLIGAMLIGGGMGLARASTRRHSRAV